MAEQIKEAKLYLTVATHVRDGEEPLFGSKHMTLPFDQAKGIIEGTHVIVPKEPTGEMLKRGVGEVPSQDLSEYEGSWSDFARDIYTSMIGAANSPHGEINDK